MRGWLLSVVLAWAVWAPAVGQITLSGIDMPKPGNEYCISRTNFTLYPVIYQTGANQTWDFRYILPFSQDSLFYNSGLQTPYGANPLLWPVLFNRFGRPTADIPDFINDLAQENIGFSITDQFKFFDNGTVNQLRLSARGFTIGGIPVALPYENSDDVLQLPYTYQSAHQDSFAFTIGIPTQIGIRVRGERSSVCNGWGTVILRTDTFQALRVEHTISAVYDFNDFATLLNLPDSIDLAIPVTTVEVEWYAPRVGHPIAKASGLDLFGLQVFAEFAFQDTDRLPLPEFVALGPTTGCRPLAVSFENQSIRALTYEWDFGDGTTSTEENPTHVFNTAGTYTVTLTATNWLGNRTRTRQNYIVSQGPNAAFTANPGSPVDVLEPVQFFNTTNGGTAPLTYYWLFGDGIGSTLQNPAHYYLNPGEHTATLIVTDANGCADTVDYPVMVQALTSQTAALETRNGWALYPNPAPQGVVMVLPPAGTAGTVALSLSNMQGQEVWHTTQTATPGQPLRLEIPAHIATGIYALRAQAPGHAPHTFRVQVR